MAELLAVSLLEVSLSRRVFLRDTKVIDKPKSIGELDNPHPFPTIVFVVDVYSLHMPTSANTIKDFSEGRPEICVTGFDG